MIHLDHNATTPVLPAVLDAMLPWLREEGSGNPSSDHALGRRALAATEAARTEVAALVGASASGVVFTGSGTEANHLALWGTCRGRPPARIVSTTLEHPAVDWPLQVLAREGHTVVRVPSGSDGIVTAEALLRALEPGTRLLSVMLANNETGAVQPIATVGPRARALGVRVHTDAAQAGARWPIDLAADGLDLVTLVGHKMGAPKGIGALVLRDGVEVEAQLGGGGQEHGRRAGTENVASIVGFGVACRLAREQLRLGLQDLGRRRDLLEARLRRGLPGLRVSTEAGPRLPNTLHVCVPGVSGKAVLRRVPDLLASTGAACHAHGVETSAVLVAMGVEPALARGALRLSLGPSTTDDEVETAARALIAAVEEVHRGD